VCSSGLRAGSFGLSQQSHENPKLRGGAAGMKESRSSVQTRELRLNICIQSCTWCYSFTIMRGTIGSLLFFFNFSFRTKHQLIRWVLDARESFETLGFSVTSSELFWVIREEPTGAWQLVLSWIFVVRLSFFPSLFVFTLLLLRTSSRDIGSLR